MDTDINNIKIETTGEKNEGDCGKDIVPNQNGFSLQSNPKRVGSPTSKQPKTAGANL